jgi:hypothetical protein
VVDDSVEVLLAAGFFDSTWNGWPVCFFFGLYIHIMITYHTIVCMIGKTLCRYPVR